MKKMIDEKLFTENNEVKEFMVLGHGKTRPQHKKTINKGLIISMSERYKKCVLQNFSLLSIIGFPCTSSELKSLRNSRVALDVCGVTKKEDRKEVNKRYSLYLRYYEMTV